MASSTTRLAPFGALVRRRIEQWAERSPVAVPAPDPAHAELRLDPYIHLPRLAAALDDMRRTVRGPGKVLWFFDSLEHRGLDAEEVRALLDPWLTLEIVDQADLGGGLQRVVAAGRFRQEHLGLSVTLGRRAVAAARRTERLLAELLAGGVPPAVLFVTRPAALLLAASARSPLRDVLRTLARAGTAPGLLIPGPSVNALALRAYAACLHRLWHGRAPELVVRCRVAPSAPATIQALAAVAEDVRATFDLSVAVAPPGPFPDGVRRGAYFATGAYVPQRFDLRTPAAASAQPPWLLELARRDLPADGVYRLWQDTFDLNVPLLSRLTDYFRIESYMRRSSDHGLAQRYHEFRVYNWGTDPSPARTLLVDAGMLPGDLDARALLRDVGRLAAERGPRFHAAPVSFFDAARVEAAERCGAEDPLRIQADEHGYLERIPRDAPVRADVDWLIGGLPQELGLTLELGAGYGRLAAALAPRASRYVCLDLDPAVMASLVREAGRDALVADIHRLPFLSGRFRTIVANNVLEHAYDPVAALAEIARLLTPRGTLHALIPLDALNPRHRLRAHLWKADLENIQSAADAAGLAIETAEVASIYAMGVAGSFPSCDGLVCRLRARRAGRWF